MAVLTMRLRHKRCKRGEGKMAAYAEVEVIGASARSERMLAADVDTGYDGVRVFASGASPSGFRVWNLPVRSGNLSSMPMDAFARELLFREDGLHFSR
jgi:hypothetical protein